MPLTRYLFHFTALEVKDDLLTLSPGHITIALGDCEHGIARGDTVLLTIEKMQSELPSPAPQSDHSLDDAIHTQR